jgi:3-oxoacyl-[acyl-carrier protein] reductase
MFTGKVAIVTGAASGIGKSCFLSFMNKNANVVAVDLNGQRLEEISKNINNNRHIYVSADITKRNNIENIVSSTLKKFGKIDILVNCAGICQEKSVEDLTETDWDRMIDINLKGTFFLCQAVLKEMKKNQSGKIVCMGSVAGEVGGILVGANYSSSKAGIICLTKSLAKYAAPHNINVNCVSPGFIDTEMTKNLAQDPKAVPLGRRGKPEDVSDVILFLSSDASRYITGANIDVNGGLFMG